MWEPLFLYRGKLGFSGSPTWCPLPCFSFPQSMQAALAAIISWGVGGLLPQLLGPRVVKPPRGRGSSSLVWVSLLGGGQRSGEKGRQLPFGAW